jgi:predicted GNAT family acetyltransferase
MSTEFQHDPDARRYTMLVDGEVVSIADYLDHGVGVVFHHTVTVPKHRGRGYADRLITFAMDDVEARGAGPVRATCWYVAEWFDRHPERTGLLAAR